MGKGDSPFPSAPPLGRGISAASQCSLSHGEKLITPVMNLSAPFHLPRGPRHLQEGEQPTARPAGAENESCPVIFATKKTMAEDIPAESFQDEASCSICLGFFQDPVSIHCGHNFCRACITRCWEEEEANFTCPRCKETAPQRNLRPNRELAKIIEIAKRLSLQAAKGGAGGERLCEKHQEALKLFCEEDQTPICLVCRESQAHRAHPVVPIEEAAEEHKVRGLRRGGNRGRRRGLGQGAALRNACKCLRFHPFRSTGWITADLLPACSVLPPLLLLAIPIFLKLSFPDHHNSIV